MNTKDATSFKDQKEKLNTFLEIASIEKQLLASMYSKGILHKDVRELYHKARTSYENIILSEYEAVGLQEVEFSLWKLHYKHIDEYRKLIRNSSAEKIKNGTSDEDKNTDAFKSFLSEATLFYRELVKKLRTRCGLPGELLLHKNGESAASCFVEPKKFPQCRYACHRFLICLGDLARYGELCKKNDDCNWLASTTYYIEASWIWPDSGNPHNQLALLARYIGDDFLAVYHCVRSLAVKEPFPDAWNNLMLLFEENSSSHFGSISSLARLNLLNPSERTRLECKEGVSFGESDIWPLFVRLISFFLFKSSLEDFSHTFASVLRQLEALMALGDEELEASLESYRFMDPSRKGPYRTLQLITIFIFIFHCLTESDSGVVRKELDDKPESELTKLTLTATFICTGRILERCLDVDDLQECPLLPATLVFIEWLVNTLERVEAHAADERVASAMSYFFGTLSDLLNRLVLSNEEIGSDNAALWEDHELKGFDPMARAHVKLDFTSHQESMDSFNGRSTSRTRRIFLAATKHGNLSNWIVYDDSGKRFNTVGNGKGSVANEHKESQNLSGFDSDSITTEEEEEVILFKPITRHNSAPVYTSRPSNDCVLAEGMKEGARRASSLLVGQNHTQNDTFSFYPDTTNSRFSHPLKPQEKDSSSAYSSRPPSFKAWVIDNEIHNENEVSRVDSSCDYAAIHDAPPYVSPVPSAPFIPEDASWFKLGNREGEGILGPSPMSGYPNVPTTRGPFPSFPDGYSPLMSSSEWLYHYRNRQNYMWPSHFNNAPMMYTSNVDRYDVLDQWGNPMVSGPTALYLGSPPLLPSPLATGTDEHRRNNSVFGFQRLSPYGCATAGFEWRSDQPTLLHYLKERELQLHPESQFRGPTFMGN